VGTAITVNFLFTDEELDEKVESLPEVWNSGVFPYPDKSGMQPYLQTTL